MKAKATHKTPGAARRKGASSGPRARAMMKSITAKKARRERRPERSRTSRRRSRKARRRTRLMPPPG